MHHLELVIDSRTQRNKQELEIGLNKHKGGNKKQLFVNLTEEMVSNIAEWKKWIHIATEVVWTKGFVVADLV